jgi:hypothetical protein
LAKSKERPATQESAQSAAQSKERPEALYIIKDGGLLCFVYKRPKHTHTNTNTSGLPRSKSKEQHDISTEVLGPGIGGGGGAYSEVRAGYCTH